MKLSAAKLGNFVDSIKELLLLYTILVLICAAGYSYFEGKSFFDSVWWACVTAMTVGYGDMYPATQAGKIIGIILMHTSVLLILPLLIGNICARGVKNANEFTHHEQEELKTRMKHIEELLEGENKCLKNLDCA